MPGSDVSNLIYQTAQQSLGLGKNRLVQVLSEMYGPAGQLFGTLTNIAAVNRNPTIPDIRQTFRVMRDAGFDMRRPDQTVMMPLGAYYEPEGDAGRGGRFSVAVLPEPKDVWSPPVPTDMPTRRETPSAPPRRGVSTVSTVSPVGSRRTSSPRTPPEDVRGQAYVGPLQSGIEEAENPFENEIETPESSNVFSIAYDRVIGIVYVTYKAPSPYDAGSVRDDINSCTGDPSRIFARPHVRGPMYWYGTKARPVPEAVWNDLVSASSKGKWIWQNFRVCGSPWQHQIPYGLMQPTVVGMNLYVPRRATEKGYRVRTVATVGRGKRPYRVSNLPEELKDW